MLPTYSGAVNGMQAAQQALDITSNNIANANTAGFTAADPTLTDLVYQDHDPSNLINTNQSATIGVGAHVDGSSHDLRPGSPYSTGNPLDVAIGGGGYLAIQQADGTTAYTRSGALRIDGQGQVNINEQLLLPRITLPTTATDAEISTSGQISAMTNDGRQILGQVQLARFTNEQGLQAIGNTTYVSTVASGKPTVGTPTQPGFGALQPGMLEAARVDLAREMTALIITERSYGLNSRALQTIDRMIGDVTHK